VKRWYYIVLAGLGILGIVYVYLHRQELGLTTPHGFGSGDASSSGLVASSSRPAQITWQTVDRTADGFRVEMPIDTREIQIPAYNQSGGTDQVNMIYSNPSSDTTFSVAWADDPPVMRASGRNPDRILDMARDEALARTQTSLVTETNSTPGGYPARDILARNVGGGVMDFRLLTDGQRLYMMIAAFPSMSARREQDVARFFNSLTLTESPRIPRTLPLAPARNN
jgi:hypothetical protein